MAGGVLTARRRRIVGVVLLAVAALSAAGCDPARVLPADAASPGEPSGGDRPSSRSETPDDVASPSAPTDPGPSTDPLADCRDGTCTVEVTAGTIIEFDSSVSGVASVSVDAVRNGLVRLSSRYPGGGGGFIAASQGGVSSVNGLAVGVVEVDGTTAVLDIDTR